MSRFVAIAAFVIASFATTFLAAQEETVWSDTHWRHVPLSGFDAVEDSSGNVLVLMSDEVAAGDTNNIFVARFDSDGNLDETFGTDGYISYDSGNDDFGTAIAIDTDDSFFVTGYFDSGTDEDVIVLAFTADGELDVAFSTDGIATFDNGDNDRGHDIAVDSSGNVVIVGRSNNGADEDGLILRYTPTGSLDTTFNAVGSRFYDSTDEDELNGLVLVGSAIYAAGNTGTSPLTDVLLLAVTSAGALDTNFDGDGVATRDAAVGNSTDTANSIALSGSTLYVVGAVFTGIDLSGTVVRFGTDGIPIGAANYTTANGSTDHTDIVVDAGGNYFITGTHTDSGFDDQQAHVLKYTAANALDTTFDANGIVIIEDESSESDLARAILIHSSGDAIMVGGVDSPSLGSVTHLHYKQISSAGVVRDTGSGSGQDGDEDVLIDEAGMIVTAGWAWNGADWDVFVRRFDDDGVLDTTFGTDGIFLYDGGDDESASAIIDDGSGGYYICGDVTTVVDSDGLLLHIDSNGDLVTAFDGDGILTYDNSSEDYFIDLVRDASGNLYVVADVLDGVDFDVDIIVAKYDGTGAPDTTFDGDGFALYDTANVDDESHGIALDGSDRVLVVGEVDQNGGDVLLFRLTTAGAIDTTFDTDGTVTFDNNGGSDAGNDVEVSGTDIYVTGYAAATDRDFLVLRLDDTGALDTDWDLDGALLVDFGDSDTANDMAFDDEGRLILVGNTGLFGNFDFAAARVTTAGVLDGDFDTDGRVTWSSGVGSDVLNAVDADCGPFFAAMTAHGNASAISFSGVPDTPTNLRKRSEGAYSVTLRWDDNADDETAYYVEVRAPKGSFKVDTVTEPNVTQVTVDGLSADTEYDFRVRALNCRGFSAYSNQIEVDTDNLGISCLIRSTNDGSILFLLLMGLALGLAIHSTFKVRRSS